MASKTVNKADPEGEDLAAVFIDNSNVFIRTQKYYGLGFRQKVQDVCRRIDYVKLLEMACKGKTRLNPVRLYGSEPPPLDKVVEKICSRDPNIEVQKYKRDNISNRETHTDTALVVDAVSLIVTLGDKTNSNLQESLKKLGIKNLRHKFIVLFSGDTDMIPVIEMATKYGWKVQVWFYSKFLPGELKQLAGESNLGKSDDDVAAIKIIEMEKHSKDFTYHEWEYDMETTRPDSHKKYRQAYLIFKSSPLLSSGLMEKSRKNLISSKITSAASAILRLPVQGCFIDNTKFLIVIRVEERLKLNEKDQEETTIYDYKVHVVDKYRSLREALESQPELNGLELQLVQIDEIKEKTH